MSAARRALPAAITAVLAAEDGLTFAPRPSVGRTGDLVAYARASTVAILKQFSDPVLLRCIGLECLGAYSLETLARGVHARHLDANERRKLQEAIEVGIDPERLADVVGHFAFHDARRVWLEKQSAIATWRRRDVDQRAAGTTPDAMPFSLDEHVWPLPYSPSDACLSAHARELLVDVVKATDRLGAIDWHRHQERQRRFETQLHFDEGSNVVGNGDGCDRHARPHVALVCERPGTAAVIATALLGNSGNGDRRRSRP